MPSDNEKVFVISLHRTMTRSTDALLSMLGYETMHHPKYFRGHNLQESIRGIEDQPEKIMDILRPVIESADAFGDVPFPALYRYLAQEWPNSKFLLIQRDPESWVKSVRNHLGDKKLTPFNLTQYYPYLGRKIERLSDISDQYLLDMYNQHITEVKEFFTRKNEMWRLCVLDVQDQYLGEKISGFLGKSPVKFPVIKGKGTDPALLGEWIEMSPFKADPHYFLADIYYNQGLLSDADLECNKAIDLDPYNPKPYKLLYHINKKKQCFFEACFAAEQAVNLGMQNSRLSFKASIGNVFKGRLGKGVNHLFNSLKLKWKSFRGIKGK